MKAFLGAVIAAILVAVGAAYILDDMFQMSASDAFTTTGARVDQPGSNLVEF